MTVNVTKPALNLHAELKAPPVVRRWLEQQFWFESLFAPLFAPTGWSTGTTTISGTNPITFAWGGVNSYAFKYFPTVIGQKYSMAVSFTGSLPRLYASTNGTNGTPLAVTNPVSGTRYTFDASLASMSFGMAGDGGSAVVSGVGIYPCDASGAIIHALPLGWKPLHVHEDGRLKREGALEDYTVSFDGFRHSVKPAIAPGAATETCVIAIREGADQ